MESLKNKKGQSTVEYVLLLGVVALLVTAFLKSERLRSFLGPDGEMFEEYARYMGYTYRHGREGQYTGANFQEDYIGPHDSYTNRFRIPVTVYPEDGNP